MSGCRPEAVEALHAGELDAAEAARVSAHVAACADCAEEMRWLTRERRVFAERAAEIPGPPPLAAVLAAISSASSAEVRPVEALPARQAPRAAEAIPARTRPTARRGERAPRGESAQRSGRTAPAWIARGMAAAVALGLVAALMAWPQDPGPPSLRAEPVASAPTAAPAESCYACASEPAPAPAPAPAPPLDIDAIIESGCNEGVGVTCGVCEPLEE